MQVTKITSAVKTEGRCNIFIDGKYTLSLDIAQVSELGIKVGLELDESDLSKLEQASQFGKLYTRTLEYALSRPHSQREIKDYLYRKTLDKKYKVRGKNELKTSPGVSQSVADAVFERLVERSYVDDTKFALFWVENRRLTKGVSRRMLTQELTKKGISASIIAEVLSDSDRTDNSELKKVILKKRRQYDDEQKLIAYLARQGFHYDDIRTALAED